jgi:long-chain acyl-CoA synthetase
MTTTPLTQDQAIEILGAKGSPYELEPTVIDGVELTVFAHQPRNLGQVYALASMHDARTMMVYEDERYTFAEVRQRAANLAHHLQTTLGVGKGDRVALAMRNYPEWCFAYMAATTIGAVIVPLNAWWTGPELRYGLRDSGARLLIVDEERLDRVLPELQDLQVRVLAARCSGSLPDGVGDLAPLLEGTHAAPVVDVDPDDNATIMYTSGSTGSPKGVVSTHRAVLSAVFTWEFVLFARLMPELPPELVERIQAWLSQGPKALASRPLELPQSSMLVTVPLFHVTGCNVQFLPAFRSGRKIVMMHKWNPERALELIEREGITDFNGVPTMSWELVNSPSFKKRDTSTLRSLSAGGASRPPEHVKQLRDQAQHALPSTGYGMTETNSVGAAIGGEDYIARPASVGKPVPPLTQLKIVDERGRALGVDEEGEICIKSATNMRGYWNQPNETERSLRNGWVHTGDLGKIDAEGFLFITGRAKDIVIRGGENISCPEIEHVMYEHPAVFEAAAYGVPDARLGEVLVATIRMRDDASVTPDEIKAHVASRLALYKVPAHVWVQRSELPRIASGKLDKRSLRKVAIEKLGLPSK